MGNDGGSIPTRRELVKNAARAPTVSELKATALEALAHAWTTDPLSGDPLDLDNVVSDWRGRLYNYETVLQYLAGGGEAGGDKEDGGAAAADGVDAAADESSENNGSGGGNLTFAATGIRSLRDVVRLHGTPYKKASSSASPTTRWQCPVSLKELGPAAKAVYLVPCGHVFSEVAVETVLTDGLCPECSTAFNPDNVVAVLPTDKAEVAKLKRRMDALRAEGLTHSLKKDKSSHSGEKKKDKKKKRKAAGAEEDGDEAKKDSVGPGEEDGAPPPKKKKEKAAHNGLPPPSADKKNGIASRINNPMTASLTAKVLAEQEALHKQRRLAETR